MASGGPNIQLELRLAEMARMNEEIKRRHMEVEADKQRAKRSGNMVSSAQSITMQTQMPADYDGSREDGFKDGLDSRPLPADPYGKDRVPRDKRGKPGDMKLKKKGREKGVYGNMPQQSIDEARQRGIGDSEFWRSEQAKCDIARIQRARGRDGTWKREWDREKHPDEERANNYSKNSGGRRSNDKMSRQDRNFDRSNNSRGGRNDRGDRQNRDSGYSQFRDNRRDKNNHRGGLEPGFEGPAPPRRNQHNDRDRGSRDHRDFGDRDNRIRRPINPLEGPTRPGGRFEKRQNRRAHNEEQRELDQQGWRPTEEDPHLMNNSWGSSGQVVERKPAALADFSSEDEHPVSNSISDFEDGNLPAPPSIDSSPTEEDYEKYDQEVALAKYEEEINEHATTQNEDNSQSASNEIEQELAKVLAEAKIASVMDAEKTDHIEASQSGEQPLEEPLEASLSTPMSAEVAKGETEQLELSTNAESDNPHQQTLEVNREIEETASRKLVEKVSEPPISSELEDESNAGSADLAISQPTGETTENTNEEEASEVTEEVKDKAEVLSPLEQLEASDKTKNNKTETEKPVDDQKCERIEIPAKDEQVKEKTQSGQENADQAEICEPAKSVETQEAAIEQDASLSEEPKQVDNEKENTTESSTPVESEASKTDSTT